MQKLRGRAETCLRGNLLVYLTLVGVVAGVCLGAILKSSHEEDWTERERMYVSFPGQIFLQMLKALTLPLIISSIVSAIGSLDLKTSWRIAARAIAYYATTTIIAVTTGVVMAATVRPGDRSIAEVSGVSSRTTTITDTLLDLIRNIFPPNLVQGCIARFQTTLIEPTPEEYEEATAAGKNLTLYEWKITGRFVDGSNNIGMVIFAIALGISIAKMEEGGRPLLELFDSMANATMGITRWALWLSPVGVASMVTSRVMEIDSMGTLMQQLGWYLMTILSALFIHGFVSVPLLYFIMTRKQPYRYLYNLMEALVTAFGTASSNAALPVSMRCVEENNHVDVRVTKCVMPIGVIINMDGTALYEASAALFIAQLRNIPLSIGQYIIVSLTATLATMGLAGIPQSGLVSLVLVLDSVGLPASDVSIIIVIDWFLERFRTTVNVISDSVGVGIVDHLSRGELDEADAAQMRHGRRGTPAAADLKEGVVAQLLVKDDVTLKISQ